MLRVEEANVLDKWRNSNCDQTFIFDGSYLCGLWRVFFGMMYLEVKGILSYTLATVKLSCTWCYPLADPGFLAGEEGGTDNP